MTRIARRFFVVSFGYVFFHGRGDDDRVISPSPLIRVAPARELTAPFKKTPPEKPRGRGAFSAVFYLAQSTPLTQDVGRFSKICFSSTSPTHVAHVRTCGLLVRDHPTAVCSSPPLLSSLV